MPVKRMRPLLGTFVEISVDDSGPGDANRAIDHAFAAIENIQRMASFHDPYSELSQINRHPQNSLKVSHRLYQLLQLAHRLSRLSNDYFNIAIGAQQVIDRSLPDHGFIHLQNGTSQDWHCHQGRIILNKPVLLVVDGIAKGFAVDLAVKTLKAHGITSGSVNAGGDLKVFGDIKLPICLRIDGAFKNFGQLKNAALATSSNKDDSFPAQLMDYAANQVNKGSWTVISNSAWRADALTKVAAASTANIRRNIIQQLGGFLLELPSNN